MQKNMHMLTGTNASLKEHYQTFTGVSQRPAFIADFMMLSPQLLKVVEHGIYL